MALLTTPNLSLQATAKRIWGAHATPERVAALIALGLDYRSRGYRIGENFHPMLGGGVSGPPTHSTAGCHYGATLLHGLWCGWAFDINVGASGAPLIEQRAMSALGHEIMRYTTMRLLYGEDAPGHWNHGHLDITPQTRSTFDPYVSHVDFPLGYEPRVPVKRTVTVGSHGRDVARLKGEMKRVSLQLREANYKIDFVWRSTDRDALIIAQRVLRDQGRYTGALDGIPGAGTRAALRLGYWRPAVGR